MYLLARRYVTITLCLLGMNEWMKIFFISTCSQEVGHPVIYVDIEQYLSSHFSQQSIHSIIIFFISYYEIIYNLARAPLLTRYIDYKFFSL